MTIQDYYDEAKQYGHHSLKLLIEYLVLERKVVAFTDNADKLNRYLEPRFSKKMNEYLSEYEERKMEANK